jgi:DNA repair ATPase RecN
MSAVRCAWCEGEGECGVCDAERTAQLRSEVARLTRANIAIGHELERWRHGNTIEGDFVCPDSLQLTDARKEIEQLKQERRRLYDSLNEFDDELGHSVFMSAGWKRLAKLATVERDGHRAEIDGLVRENERLNERLDSLGWRDVESQTRTATIRECAAKVQSVLDECEHTMDDVTADAERRDRVRFAHSYVTAGYNRLLALLPDAERGQ